MPENMFCENQKVPSDKYRENFDSIFGCGTEVATHDAVILMQKAGAQAWVAPKDVKKKQRQGWRKVHE